MAQPASSQSQVNALVIDPEKPFVFVSFDRVGRPPMAPGNGGSDLLWLRIRNNSRVPIEVNAIEPEADTGGVEVMHEVVKAADLQGFSSGPPNSSAGWISPPEHYLPIDVATTMRIEPGMDLRFSVPLNHVGPSWYFRLTFQFVLPSVRSGRQPQGVVDFEWADVPTSERKAWKGDVRKGAEARRDGRDRP
jgi:hypothetical protein